MFGRLQRRFPGANLEDIEDAVGAALVDLCDYWLGAPGSVTADPDRNFWFAVRRATWIGLAILGQETSLHASQASLDDLMASDREPHDDGPEDDYIEEVEREMALQLVAGLGDDRAGWLKGHLGGMTCRQEAAVVGVSPMTISRRRARALSALLREARRVELV